MIKTVLGLSILSAGFLRLAGSADSLLGQDVSSAHWPRSPKQTPGVELMIEEVQRSAGRRGTQVVYRIVSNGFPRDKTYKLESSSLSQPKPATLVTHIEVSDTGSLIVGRVGNQNQLLEVSKFAITIDNYNKGEFFMIEVVSEDGVVYARDRVYPFPIAARDGECRLLAELITKDRKSFGISGTGFDPSTDVRINSSEDDGKDPKSATQRVGSDGSFVSAVAHRRAGGVGAFVAAGVMCEVTLRYEFGRQATGPQ
jgi:hypothetical protein